MSAIALYNRPSATFDAKVAASIALLQRVATEHQPLTQASSLGVEDMIVTDLIARHRLPIAIGTLETGMLNPETAAPYGENKISVFYVLPYAFLFAAVLPYMAVRFLAFRAEVRMHQVGIYVAVMGGR